MIGRRSLARRYAVLALYQWQLGGGVPADIARQFYDDPVWSEALAEGLAEEDAPAPGRRVYDVQLFDALLRGVTEHVEDIDAALHPLLDRALSSIDPVERAILRLGAYELLYCPELPAAVVIDEAIELAKLLGAEQGHRYVNGVLDQLARRLGHRRAAS